MLKNKEKKTRKDFINIGTTSLLMFFVILCLAIFSVLSLTSANADLKLSKKTKDFTISYYKAEAKSEVILSKIDSLFNNTTTPDIKSLEQALGNLDCQLKIIHDSGELIISYDIPLDNGIHELQIKLKTCFISSEENINLKILNHCLMNNAILNDNWSNDEFNLLNLE